MPALKSSVLSSNSFGAYPLYEPSNDWKKEGIHISKSYDATSHFETISDDVIRIYKEITGESDVSYLFVPKEKKTDEK